MPALHRLRLAWILLFAVLTSPDLLAQSFEIYPDLRQFVDVSDDGSKAMAITHSGEWVMWVDGEIVPLNLPADFVPRALSGLGDVILGEAVFDTPVFFPDCVKSNSRCSEPFQYNWRTESTYSLLPLPDEVKTAWGVRYTGGAVSDDGTIVTSTFQYSFLKDGGGLTGSNYTFRWTNGILEVMGVQEGVSPGFNQMNHATADGSTLVGFGIDDAGKSSAMSFETVAQSLGFGDDAKSISPDGRFIVGRRFFPTGQQDGYWEPFLWNEGSVISLGFVDATAGGNTVSFSTAISVSRSGEIVLGAEYNRPNNYTFSTLWTSSGIKALPDALVGDYGLDLSAIDLNPEAIVEFKASTMSPDGVIIGLASQPVAPRVQVPWMAKLFPQSQLFYSIDVSNSEPEVGDEFDVVLTVANEGTIPVTDIMATVARAQDSVGDADLLSGPEPAVIPTIEAGESADITYRYEATVQGLLRLDISIVGMADGASVDAVARCLIRTDKSGGNPRTCSDEIPISGDIVVNSTGDGPDIDATDGGTCSTGEMVMIDAETEVDECTLRAAIQTAQTLGRATIRFAIEGTETPVIAPQVKLPTIDVPLIIDGTSQQGGIVHLEGDESGIQDGLLIKGTDKVEIRGLAVTKFERWGLHFDGGKDHVVLRSRIGFRPGAIRAQAPSGVGGILLTNSVTNTKIGSDSEDDENLIHGGIVILGDNTRGVAILRNELAVDPDKAGIDRSPIDLGEDGAACFPWKRTGEGPNASMPSPRILSITDSRATGMTSPGSQVVVYKLNSFREMGENRGRYWPAWVVPIGIGTADNEGSFAVSFDEPVPLFTQITASAIDPDGNTSELTQLKRPVVYVPGIGGSWLLGTDNEKIWVPINDPFLNANSFLAKMALTEQGGNLFNLRVDGIVEFGGFAVYGPTLESLEGAGYVDDSNPTINDLWRFPYDWRTNTADRAHELKALVERVTSGASDLAVSCDVDLVTHSNGGLVSSVYVKRDSTHSQNKVHRLIQVASPYLGAAKAASAHASGYVFDIEKVLHFDAEWGRMIKMATNMTASYGLMPSRNYWRAASSTSASHDHGYLFMDLYGKPLKSYDATAKLFTDNKIGPDDFPLGLERNQWMLADQQETVHDLIDDWTGWNRPPQIFRQAGSKVGSTPTGYFLQPRFNLDKNEPSMRREEGDFLLHWEWRDRIVPIFGTGDETVPLVSASLGAAPEVSDPKFDFSGEDSQWIEPTEYYNCTHTNMVAKRCNNVSGQGRTALEAVNQILHAGYLVINQESANNKASRAAAVPGAEIFYVTASGPVTIAVEDSSGSRTGPRSAAEYRLIEYGLPEISYFPGEYGAVVSVPTDKRYTLTINAPTDTITVRVHRMQVEAPDESRQNIVFEDQDLAAGGSVRVMLESGATPEGKALDLDADGDGAFESTIEPIIIYTGTIGAPAVPYPTPAFLRAGAVGDESVTGQIVLPDVGAPGWTWTLTESTSWIELSELSGTAPAEILVELAADVLTDTLNTADIMLTLSFGDYSVDVQIPVQLHIGDVYTGTEDIQAGVPKKFGLSHGYPNPFAGQVTFEVSITTRQDVQVAVFDLLGRTVAVLHDGYLEAGRYDLVLSADGLPRGTYFVRARSAEGVQTRTVVHVGR